MALHWDKDAHAFGSDIIDAVDRLVIDVINRMKAYDRARGERDQVGDCLTVLESHLARQFLHEESVMMLAGSPRLDEQRREHRRMLGTLASLRRQHGAGEDVLPLLTLNLVAFRESHLRGTDADEFADETVRRRVA